jgi:hypothetical protein
MATTPAHEAFSQTAGLCLVSAVANHVFAPAFLALALGLVGSNGLLVTHDGDPPCVVDFPFG